MMPAMWKKGETLTTVSSSGAGSSAAESARLATRLRWVSITPFGATGRAAGIGEDDDVLAPD